MKRIEKNNIAIAIIAMFGLSIGIMVQSFFVSKVHAATLSNGGSAFESATAISAGTYTVGVLAEKEDHYYSISLKAGQELSVTGTFKVDTEHEQYGTMNTIEIFDDAKESLVSNFKDAGTPVLVAALADSSKSTHTFYIRISDDTWGTESGTLEVALNDRFDANSGTDAGIDFDNALAIIAGSYTGNLSRMDTEDFYTISGVKGNVSAKVTPAKDAIPEVKIYDADRKELADEFSSNEGEIITASAELTADQKVFVSVKCDYNMGCASAASQYSLVISNGTGTVPDDGGEIVVPEEFLDFGGIVPVVPTGGAADINTIVRPPLDGTFGNEVKVKEATSERVVYVVDRVVAATDLNTIKAAMEASGYKTKSISATKLVMTKGFKEITFLVAEGSNQISVTSKFVMNWLWAGIIIGVLTLIILIIVILAVKKKKPAVAPASKPAEEKIIINNNLSSK